MTFLPYPSSLLKLSQLFKMSHKLYVYMTLFNRISVLTAKDTKEQHFDAIARLVYCDSSYPTARKAAVHFMKQLHGKKYRSPTLFTNETKPNMIARGFTFPLALHR
jgi:hypothetical protein